MWRRVQGLQDKCWEGIWSDELSEFCWKFCRFHSYCVDLTPEQVTNMDKYTCASCAPENHKRASGPSHKTPDMKVINAWYFSRVICLAAVSSFHPSWAINDFWLLFSSWSGKRHWNHSVKAWHYPNNLWNQVNLAHIEMVVIICITFYDRCL